MIRVLAFTDPHGGLDAADSILKLAASMNPDIIVCSGDISYFGARFDGFLTRLKGLRQDVFFVPGNHETEDSLENIRLWYPFMKDVSFNPVEVKGLVVVGLPATMEFWPDGNFDAQVKSQALALLKRDRSKTTILLSHYPPWKSEISGIGIPTPDSGGSRLVLEITRELEPSLMICGHYHQDFKKSTKLGSTKLSNPGPDGTIYEFDL